MGGGGSVLPPLAADLLGVAGLSVLPALAGLSDLMPAKLLNRRGKS